MAYTIQISSSKNFQHEYIYMKKYVFIKLCNYWVNISISETSCQKPRTMSKWMKILCFVNKLAYFIWPTFLGRQFPFTAIVEQLKYFTIRWKRIGILRPFPFNETKTIFLTLFVYQCIIDLSSRCFIMHL